MRICDTFPFFYCAEAASRRSNSDGITELIKALDRRGPRGLEEKEANAEIIAKILAGEML